jgi:hypothetical protein
MFSYSNRATVADGSSITRALNVNLSIRLSELTKTRVGLDVTTNRNTPPSG